MRKKTDHNMELKTVSSCIRFLTLSKIVAYQVLEEFKVISQYQIDELVNELFIKGYWKKYLNRNDYYIMYIMRFDIIRYMQNQTKLKILPPIPRYTFTHYHPERIIVNKELVKKLLSYLTLDEQIIISLAYFENLNDVEISDKIKVSRVWINNLKNRALHKMRKKGRCIM